MPRLTPALRWDYPRLTVLWVEDKTEALARSVDSGTLDAALVALEAGVGEVEWEIEGYDRFVLATPRDHLRGDSLVILQCENHEK